jgi:hypothetical protein
MAKTKARTKKAPASDEVRVEYVRPWVYKKQREAIFDPVDCNGDPARFSFIEASTKAGKTVGCIAWLTEQAMLNGRPGRNYWWIAPIFPQAKIAYRRLKRYLPAWAFTSNETELTITLLVNGAVIWFKGADKPDSLYGEDVDAAVLDEASRMKEEAWHAIRSTLTATRGPARFIGNVKGRKNWFFRLARLAESGAAGMAYHKITAFDAVEGGVLDMEEINAARRDLPDFVFRELYLAEPSDDGGNPFGLQHIAACTKPGCSEELPAAFGVDLAKHIDWTVVVGIDDAGGVCGIERWQSPWGITKTRVLEVVGRIPTLVDSTGVGDPIVEEWQGLQPNIEGFNFTQKSKQQLMEGLAVAIQAHEIAIPAEGPLRAELDQFEYVHTPRGVRYSAPEGYHDDCVVALALAVRKWRDGTGAAVTGGGHVRVSPWSGY